MTDEQHGKGHSEDRAIVDEQGPEVELPKRTGRSVRREQQHAPHDRQIRSPEADR